MTEQDCGHRTTDFVWDDRCAWRGALALAPVGALLAILYALLLLRMTPVESLWAYLLGAAVASGIGCVLGGTLGGVATAVRHRRCAEQPAADPRYADGDPAASPRHHASAAA